MKHSRTPAVTRTTRDETGTGVTHEAYSFACMRCGHGWEQEYEIRHGQYPDGRPFVAYYTDGERVRSPLTHPRCDFCDGHAVRIMRSGRVAEAVEVTEDDR